MDALQARIGAWHAARFPHATLEHVALKLAAECGEATEAALGVTFDAGYTRAVSLGGVLDELADVVIVAFACAERYTNGDLLGAVEQKLAVLCDPASGHRSALRT